MKILLYKVNISLIPKTDAYNENIKVANQYPSEYKCNDPQYNLTCQIH